MSYLNTSRKFLAEQPLMDIREATAVARTSYNATELDTAVGKTLTVEDSLNGWYLVGNKTNKSGWIPAETIILLEAR